MAGAGPELKDRFGWGAYVVAAMSLLGVLMAGHMARAIWLNRDRDAMLEPVTVWRIAWLVAGIAAFLRWGTEAMNLWAWNPGDVRTSAHVLLAKRWLDPLALIFAAGWMVLILLSETGITEQLTKKPYPVRLWSSLPALRRPLDIIVLSLVAAIGVTVTR